MKSKKGLDGFGVIIAIALAVIVLLSVSLYIYPKVIEAGNMGKDNIPNFEDDPLDLVVMNDSTNFQCNDFVNVINLYDEDLRDVSISVSDNDGARTIVVNIPARTAVPIDISDGNIQVTVDSTNKFQETDETNNDLNEVCP